MKSELSPTSRMQVCSNSVKCKGYIDLTAGYASETMARISKDYQVSVFFPSEQQSAYFGGSFANIGSMQNSGLSVVGGNQAGSGNSNTGIFGPKTGLQSHGTGIFQTQSSGPSPFQNTGTFQSGGIFNPQPNTNIFNQNQHQNPFNPFNNQQQAMVYPQTPQLRQYNSEVVQAMHRPIMEEMGRVLNQQRLLPLYRNFLANYGINDDILEYLLRMGMSVVQIREFLAQRMLMM